MDQEKQRIAIANACGLKDVRLMKSSWLWRGDALVHGNETLVPNYLTDLNAIHEAENLLLDHRDWGEWIGYCVKLLGVIDSIHLDQCVRATASQRAEALLRTLNLWEE